MGDVTIKLKDTMLLAALSEMAKAHNQTLESEIQHLLEKAVEDRATRLALLHRAQQISSMTPRDIEQTDSTLLVRKDRNR